MTVDREAIWVAMLAHLKNTLSAQFKLISRRHLMPTDLSPVQQPALFLVQKAEQRDPNPYGTGGSLTLEGMLVFYFVDSSAGTPGKETSTAASRINELLKAIDGAFAGDSISAGEERFTIGKRVHHCYIESVEMDPAFFDQQAAAAVHFKILVP
jgi:hypothetical protein